MAGANSIQMEKIEKIRGLNVAVVTPMTEEGVINLDVIPQYAGFLINQGIDGVFVNGSSGEGLLLSVEERMAVLERWMEFSDKLNILVHVGHTSYVEARKLASHADKLGVRAISAMGPCFMQPKTMEDFIGYNKIIASAAPNTPFYYYHVPGYCGVNFPMEKFLDQASLEIPTLSGMKFTSQDVWTEFNCVKVQGGRFDILHGHDETLVVGLQLGEYGGIGTSFNVYGKVFKQIIRLYESGDIQAAVDLQYEADKIVRLMCKYDAILGTIKQMLVILGVPVGPARLPNRNLTDAEKADLRTEMSKYFNL